MIVAVYLDPEVHLTWSKELTSDSFCLQIGPSAIDDDIVFTSYMSILERA